jgi:hypothetical protein
MEFLRSTGGAGELYTGEASGAHRSDDRAQAWVRPPTQVSPSKAPCLVLPLVLARGQTESLSYRERRLH